MIPLEKIIVATDFNESAGTALSYARHFARLHNASLEILHVVDDVASHVVPMAGGGVPDIGEMQTELETAARKDLEALVTDDDRRSLRVRTVLLTSATTARAIVSYGRSANADLIVVGTHGRSGLATLFMGSVAQHVVRTAHCPVLTVRDTGTDAPAQTPGGALQP